MRPTYQELEARLERAIAEGTRFHETVKEMAVEIANLKHELQTTRKEIQTELTLPDAQ